MPARHENPCPKGEELGAYVLDALPAGATLAINTHIKACPDCRRELEILRALVERLDAWPTDVLRPKLSLRARLTLRVSRGGEWQSSLPTVGWAEPEWEQVAPGIECKLMATDPERNRVSMLVRLAPGANYPPHTHAGTEELHLLDGELWIDERKLLPGDYYHAKRGSGDACVRSETGCTCVLITSTEDVLQ